MEWVPQIFWPVMLALALMAAGVALFLFWAVPRLEPRFVFRPSREVTQTPARFGVPFQQLSVVTPDGERLSAWHLCPPRPRAAVLYFHGNSGNLGLFAEVLADLYRNRLQVFALDYRGYGLSSGQPSEAGLYRDALAASAHFLEHLRAEGCPVVFWGRSLGGPVAAYAAHQAGPRAVILETTFPSKRVLLRNYAWPYRFCSLFSKYRFDTLAHLSSPTLSKLVIHGDQDRTVPVELGRALFRNLEEPRHWLLIPGGDHVNIHKANESLYWGTVLEFIDRL